MTSNDRTEIDVLVIIGGHDFAAAEFGAMLDALALVRTTVVEHPAAQEVLAQRGTGFDAVLFYDMCGVPGVPAAHDLAGGAGVPTAEYAAAVNALLVAGVGCVLLNHATVSWAEWPTWRDLSGSSFLLRQGELRGQQTPGSGYRGGHGPLSNATVPLVATKSHPVLAGLEQGFEITDELYLKSANYGDNVVPLLRGDYAFEQRNFSPPPLASAEEQGNWQHPPGSDVLVWANALQNSPIVATDLGDGPTAFGNPGFRTLLANALHWVSSPDARAWAKAQSH